MRFIVEDPESVPVSPIFSGLCPQPAEQFTLRPKGMGSWQLILSVKGEGKIYYPGGERQLPPGHMVLFSPDAPQNYGNETKRIWHHLAFIFKVGPNWDRWLKWPEISPGIGWIFPRYQGEIIRKTLLQANRTGRSSHRFGKELAMDFIHQALIHCQEECMAAEGAKVDPRIKNLIDEISANLRDSHITVSAMARRVGMSPSQVLRAFERQLGTPPARFIQKLRMDRAAEMLRTTPLRIREIALAVGYDDPLYFSNRFRGATGGLSPRQYRKKMLEKPY